MKIVLTILTMSLFFIGCAAKTEKKGFDQQSYDRQNNAASGAHKNF